MSIAASTKYSARIPLAFVCVIWIFYVVALLVPQLGLQHLGIFPRSIPGLRGVIFAPMLHVGIYHLAANTVPLFVMLFLLVLQSGRRWSTILATLWIGTGLGTWIIGRSGYQHIGASGLLYGLITFLIFAGFYQRDIKSILIGLLVLLSYGTLLWKILPTYWFISWESHLTGAVVGLLVASLSPRARQSIRRA